MRLAIMQPYFLPYIGYFQLMAAADEFVIYDNIKYTKKGWINRNRMLRDGRDVVFTLPLKEGSDQLDVNQRQLSDGFEPEVLRRQFASAYRRAPQFEPTMALLERILSHPDRNLFNFILHSVQAVRAHLDLRTPLRVSSTVPVDHALKGQDKVLAMCKALGAHTYINPPGGRDLYDAAVFRAHGIELQFLQPRALEYPQLGQPFVPWLSIIDVMMFNPLQLIKTHLLGQWDACHA